MRTRCLLVVATTALLTPGLSTPASAGTTAATAATVIVQGGVLSITVRDDAGNLGTRSTGEDTAKVSGPLGRVRVNDERGAAAGSSWVASAISTPFTSTNGPAIPASAVGYTAGPMAKVGTATYTAKNPGSLPGLTAVVVATGITGDNSATWNPTISVTFPDGITAGVYSATITHSVA